MKISSIASPLIVLGLWELLARGGAIDTRFFPPPSAIVVALHRLATAGTLWNDLGITLLRLGVGVAIGATVGVLVGIAMGLNRLVRSLIQPLIAALYPIPKIAVLPLLMLIFGLGETSRIVMVAISVFFVTAISAMTGVLQIDPVYIDVGHNLGVTRWQFVRTIAWPGALPVIVGGMRLAFGSSIVVLIAAEMVAARSGLGYLIWNAWQVLAVEDMYAGLLVVSLLGLTTSFALDLLERWLVPWKVKPAEGSG